MLRSKKVALSDLNLGQSFFQKMLVLVDKTGTSEDRAQDFDIYLMEKSVMPLLVQGLDALSRHVNKLTLGEKGVGPSLSPFNPLSWLAQFLLRNHPKHVKDHRTPMYQAFSEKASIEKGRRCLIRRKHEIMAMYQQIDSENSKDGGMQYRNLRDLARGLDVSWGLQGAFATRMPTDYTGLIEMKSGSDGLLWADFWDWFSEYVRTNDVLRDTAFEAAATRKAEEEKQERRQKDEAAKREKAMEEAREQQHMFKEQFDSLTADMFLNDEIARIMHKGAVIQGVEEKDGGVPLQGEHIGYILAMLGLWGQYLPSDNQDALDDVWDEDALAAWGSLMDARGVPMPIPGFAPRLDGTTLNILMDKDAFEAYLLKAYPLHGDSEDLDTAALVQITKISDDDDFIVEAIDEDTGQVLQFLLQEGQVDEMRKKLAENSANNEPVFAHVDLITNRISEIVK